MFERFTESARQVVVLAQEEARKLRHGYIGTEHLLLGLIRENGRAATTLGAHGISSSRREWIVEHVGEGDEEPPAGQLPLTPRMKKIFEMSSRTHEAGTPRDRHAALLIALLHEGQVWRCVRCAPSARRPRTSGSRRSASSAWTRRRTFRPGCRLNDRREPQPAERLPTVALGACAASFVGGLFVGWLVWG